MPDDPTAEVTDLLQHLIRNACVNDGTPEAAEVFRRTGVTSYGYGLFSERIGFEEFGTMFHGDDERVDQESLRLSTELWGAVAADVLA